MRVPLIFTPIRNCVIFDLRQIFEIWSRSWLQLLKSAAKNAVSSRAVPVWFCIRLDDAIQNKFLVIWRYTSFDGKEKMHNFLIFVNLKHISSLDTHFLLNYFILQIEVRWGLRWGVWLFIRMVLAIWVGFIMLDLHDVKSCLDSSLVFFLGSLLDFRIINETSKIII